MYCIAIVDDHTLFRKSLRLLVEGFDGMKVINESADCNQLLQFLQADRPDIVLLDIQMPGTNGYDTIKAVRKLYPKIKILIVSQIATRESINKIFETGAQGFISKSADPNLLQEAITRVIEDNFYLGMDTSDLIRSQILIRKDYPKKIRFECIAFSDTELKIIKMACKQKSTAEMAGQLSVSNRTIDAHRKNIMNKTGSINFVGAILFAVQNNYVLLEV